jgi:gluconolactonase
MQDRKPTARRKPLATHGRTIHWVNGAIPGRSGYPSPATIQGHNMPNRVVLSTGVKAGDKFQIAVFGINGPISMAPANTVWFRQATMEFYK